MDPPATETILTTRRERSAGLSDQVHELCVAAAPMADLRLFGRCSFAATGFVAFAISATVIGTIT